MSHSLENTSGESAAAAVEHSRRLARLIRQEAASRGGRLPFDRYMDLALYAPGLGYYMCGTAKLGRQGDFVTAPEISPLFGRCIAEQCRQVLQEVGGGDILEFGAGSGALAAELLAALAAAATSPRNYYILELSADLRRRQHRLLAERVPDLLPRVHWLERLPQQLRGCVLANEVLDAMPVHRFRIAEDTSPQELFVEPTRAGWKTVAGAPLCPGLVSAVRALQDRGLALEPGYESEVNMRLAPWLRALSEALDCGLVLLIDYGYPQAEYYSVQRCAGTLMCHYRHRAQADPYRRPGLQDMTAHVDFTAVAEAACRAGFTLAGYTTQAHFLIGCGLDRIMAPIGARATSDPDAMDWVLGARQLLLPSAMGERFQVMGLNKASNRPRCGFSFRDLRARLG